MKDLKNSDSLGPSCPGFEGSVGRLGGLEGGDDDRGEYV